MEASGSGLLGASHMALKSDGHTALEWLQGLPPTNSDLPELENASLSGSKVFTDRIKVDVRMDWDGPCIPQQVSLQEGDTQSHRGMGSLQRRSHRLEGCPCRSQGTFRIAGSPQKLLEKARKDSSLEPRASPGSTALWMPWGQARGSRDRREEMLIVLGHPGWGRVS